MRRFLVLVLVVLVAIGVVLTRTIRTHSGATTTTTTAASSTTSTTPAPIAPLTGLPDPGGAALHRPALTVKVENTPEAMPQWGVAQADVVYEEIVNGGITRLAAVFNSQAPGKVGPVRSVRPTDTQVVYPLGGIFAFSGGAPYAVASISTAPVKLVDESSAGSAMFRDPNILAPHNLYARAPQLFALGGTPTPPPALFAYRSPGQAVTGPPVARVVVPFPSIYAVTWTWDATTRSWDRTLFGKSDVTGTGQRESPKNVVVMEINYVNGVGTFTSYANLQGSGPVTVFTDGHEVKGTWSRGSSKSDVIQYVGANGKPIALTPGQTWVELLDNAVTPQVTR